MLSDLLGVRQGVTSVIGSGGKTTMLGVLGRELQARGIVILCTTTKINPIEGFPLLLSPDESGLERALSEHGAVCVGAPFGNTGKLTAPELSMSALLRHADYVIVEADGSARLPLKAHAPHEPPLPPESGLAVLVIGASGLEKPIREVVHRPEIFAQLAGCSSDDVASSEAVARVIRREKLGDIAFINQFETQPAPSHALAALLDMPVFAGELHSGRWTRCS